MGVFSGRPHLQDSSPGVSWLTPDPLPQGRMLHVLPSTIKKGPREDADGSGTSSYKKTKEQKEKAASSRSVPRLPRVHQPLLPPSPSLTCGRSG